MQKVKHSRPYLAALAELKTGKISEGRIRGLRKALNADSRRVQNLSTSSTSSKMTGPELCEILERIEKNPPLIADEKQIEKGLAFLRSKQWTPKGATRKNAPLSQFDAEYIKPENFDRFELIGFDDFGRHGNANYIPIYRVVSKTGQKFDYSAGSWQSGGAVTIY
jgi:hypothetical protein